MSDKSDGGSPEKKRPEMNAITSSRKKRNKEEILASILDTAKLGATKTRIMYESFLSFSQLRRYLEYAVETGLLDLNLESKKYITTRKGTEYLKRFDDVYVTENNVMEKRRLLSEMLNRGD